MILQWREVRWVSKTVELAHYYGKTYLLSYQAPTDAHWPSPLRSKNFRSLKAATTYAATLLKGPRDKLVPVAYLCNHADYRCSVKREPKRCWFVEVCGAGSVYSRVNSAAAAKRFAEDIIEVLLRYSADYRSKPSR